MLWPSGENEEEAGRAKGRLVWKPSPHYWPQMVATEDFFWGSLFRTTTNLGIKLLFPEQLTTKSSKQPLLGVIVLILQIMELKLREVK